MSEKLYVGVDLHKTQFTICILTGPLENQTELEAGTKFPMTKDGYENFIAIVKALAESPEDVILAIESTANARYFRDTMERQGFEVQVVNTLRFKVVNLSTKKTDKNDARTLAYFLSRNLLPTSHLCSAEMEGIRRILKSRSLMVQDAVALKNQAHAILLAYGIVTRPTQFQSKSSRDKLLANLPSKIRTILGSLFDSLNVVETQTRELERTLKALTSSDPRVSLLMTIPGIGIVNACIITAYTDDINRFESYKKYSAYCGLVPWVQTSNETAYYGRITKRGPQELRTALVQCVVAMVRMQDKTGNFSLMRQYQRLKEEKSAGKAIIAIARRLSRIIYIMLKTMTPFDEAKLIS